SLMKNGDTTTGAPEGARKYLVLIVDGDPQLRELLTMAFKGSGYDVLPARNGDEAVEIALRKPPDLIVLDTGLSRRSGYEVCGLLRSSLLDPEVPVLLTSSDSALDSRVKGLSAGADDYLLKPFSPQEILL